MKVENPANDATVNLPTRQSMRERLLTRLWIGFLFIAIEGPIVSLARLPVTGWKSIYLLHIVMGVLAFVIFSNRNRIEAKHQGVLLGTVGLVLGASGLASFGFTGSGAQYLLLSCLVFGLLSSTRNTWIASVVALCIWMASATGFITGTLKLPFDANLAIKDWVFWANTFDVFAVFMFFNWAIAAFRDSTQVLFDEVSRQREVILHQATHDALTGLPTLRLAHDRMNMAISHAKRDQTKVAILFIDLDGFKAANDSFGHDAGDEVLRVVAKRLLESIREGDTAARQGGDEFILILTSVGDIESLLKRSNALVKTISEPIPYDSQLVNIGASIGIAIYPDNGSTGEEILKNADAAMYRVKKSGKNGVAIAEVSA